MRAKVGDRYVLEELRRARLAARRRRLGPPARAGPHTTGDGIVSALQVLQAVRAQRRSRLRELLEGVTLFPQTLINVRLQPGAGLEAQRGAGRRAARASTRELGGTGRVLIRASGTEPVLRVMVEARDAALVAALRASGCAAALG